MVIYQGQPATGSSSGTLRQRMAYVLLPSRSHHLRVTPTSSSTPNVNGNLSSSSNLLSDEDCVPSDGASASKFLPDNDTSFRQKRQRNEADIVEETDYAPSETDEEPSTIKCQTRREKRQKKTHTPDLDALAYDDSSTSKQAATAKPPRNVRAKKSVANKRKPSARRDLKSDGQPRLHLNSDNRLFVHPIGKTFEFSFKGRKCTHSSHPMASRRSQASKFDLSPSASADFDSSCIALEAFNMIFYWPLNLVFCSTHKACIPLSSLECHISSSTIRQPHTGTFARLQHQGVYQPFLEHVAAAFQVPIDQTFRSQGSDTKQLQKPIPYIQEPRKYFQCPSCQKWLYHTIDNGWNSLAARRHFQESPQCSELRKLPESKRPSLKVCYGQRPCGPASHFTSGVPFVEIVGWSPEMAVPSFPAPNSSEHLEDSSSSMDLSSQRYISARKWNLQFPVATATFIHKLCLLSGAPSCLSEDDDSETDTQRAHEESLERGLYEIQIFLRSYLEDANSFVSNCDVGFREAITEG